MQLALITPKAISEFVPAQFVNGILVAGFDKIMLEELNLYKFDILKLITLNVVDDCLANIKQTCGIDIDLNDIDKDDKAIYQSLCAGDVFGVFQFEAQRDFIKKMQPNTFAALTALNALVRPGTGNPEEYRRRKNGGS